MSVANKSAKSSAATPANHSDALSNEVNSAIAEYLNEVMPFEPLVNRDSAESVEKLEELQSPALARCAERIAAAINKGN